MAFNRFRLYDMLQRTTAAFLLGTTVVGSVFIGANVYNNWLAKRKLQEEMALKRLEGDASRRSAENSSG